MEPMKPMRPMKPMEPLKPMESASSDWWPAGLDAPTSSGSQDGWRYAYFPRQRRLAVERDGQVVQYETADHEISGVSQGREADTGPELISQHGRVKLESLKKVA